MTLIKTYTFYNDFATKLYNLILDENPSSWIDVILVLTTNAKYSNIRPRIYKDLWKRGILSNAINQALKYGGDQEIRKILETKTKFQNIGEKAEVVSVKYLFDLNLNAQYTTLVNIFGEDASEGITILDIDTQQAITEGDCFKKAKSGYKADYMIRMNKTRDICNISVKSKDGGPPSVMNHQRRDQSVFQLRGDLNYLLADIDKIVIKYHALRDKGLPEEIEFKKLDNFNAEDKKVLSELICYFMFTGSGDNTSKQIADSLLIIKGTDIKYIRLINREAQLKYINDNWHLFNISLISRKNLNGLTFKDDVEKKCMTNIEYKEKYDIMKPWIYETTDNGRNNPDNKIKLKTALHIRMK
jgi:hypothetical protein